VLRRYPLPPGIGDAGFRARSLGESHPPPWPEDEVARADQVHGSRVATVAGPGSVRGYDALVTRAPGVRLTVRSADCLPVLLADADAVGVVHAGWRGLRAGVLEEAVGSFEVPRLLWAVVGPAIGPCCFEVGDEVAREFPASTLRTAGRLHVDLVAEARRRLTAAGVPGDRIATGAPCTRCHQNVLPSHRGSGGSGERLTLFAVRAATG